MSKRILIVEDEPDLLDAYSMIMRHEGYEVSNACSGDEALKKAVEDEPDLILLDLRMPNKNGLDFLDEYRLMHNGQLAKIIVFSNLDTQTEIDKAYSLGADRYILKAWASPKELVKVVKDTLNE